MKTLTGHANICPFYEADIKAERAELYLEYCRLGTVYDFMTYMKNANKVVPEPFVWSVMLDITAALLLDAWRFHERTGCSKLQCQDEGWVDASAAQGYQAGQLLSADACESLSIPNGQTGLFYLQDDVVRAFVPVPQEAFKGLI
ncbi:hypothetical protein AJ79_04073 [Helicocarpus griseus UAMH5409]|uniref:Protein kinase domain-containing protein n=1 Tax=Helicocarpus griseus UAMH5409 TaxID=1447875 RepID=A0A2B7XVB2_9EURO|nr:hypothetical protein AJ79_04073 [Helicocarpus griseus UAMH5409]